MRKIGELKGKPIIEGNPNEIKNNQIHAKTEGGGITLSERKNGSLETISGSNSGNTSGDSELQYYKVAYDGTIGFENLPKFEVVIELFNAFIRYFNVVSFKSTNYGMLSGEFKATGSGVLTGEYTLNRFIEEFNNKHIIGFCIYTSVCRFKDYYNQDVFETQFKNNILETLINNFYPDGMESSEYELVKDCFDSCLIQISKEEYYNL